MAKRPIKHRFLSMKLTKDECILLANAVVEYKYDLNDTFKNSSFNSNGEVISALTKLEGKLFEFGQDKRRQGRTSQNDFSDVVKRYCKQNPQNND